MKNKTWRIEILALLTLFCVTGFFTLGHAYTPSGKLEIHYINVGQGGSTLIIGPNGTRILYDFGKKGGNIDVVPYLRDTIGLAPQDGLHYAILSHRDTDHYVGYKGIVESGYDIRVANYDSGSPKSSVTINSKWVDPAKKTTAGAVRKIPLGLAISLGDGAEIIVMAAKGHIYGDPNPVEIQNENDQSISLFLRYKNFHYILDGDLGGGPEKCTKHDTTQKDIQTRVANSLLKLGLIDAEHGVDVMHIAHHGSESSTPASYYNLMKPEVGLISVGIKNKTYLHPRKDVVNSVLLGPDRPACVTAPILKALFQTEDGFVGKSSTGETSNDGLSIGDIVLTTDGLIDYTITGNNRVHAGSAEFPENKKYTFKMDERH